MMEGCENKLLRICMYRYVSLPLEPYAAKVAGVQILLSA